MPKFILTAIILLTTIRIYSQPSNEKYFYKPFPISKSSVQAIIAGDLNTFVYFYYFGKDVKKEGYRDPHSKAEYLVFELFKDMKNGDIAGISKLYDSSFNKKDFDVTRMTNMLKKYDDIKYMSKFNSGDVVIVRYNFVSSSNQYAFFAVIRKIKESYYLTTNINVSEPFNVIGSFSPYNLFEKTDDSVNTNKMTAFYFVKNENKVFFSNDLPKQEYTAVYLAFEFYDSSITSPEISFVRQLQKAARSSDSTEMKNQITNDQLTLLARSYFSNYYNEIKKIFWNYSIISPLAAIKTNDGKILYFKYSDVGQSPNIASIILKESNGKYSLSLRMTDDNLNNVLQNIYVREAIYDYFNRRQ
jgi:hypothetical protein